MVACTERRKISLLKDVKIRKSFEEDIIDLVDVGALNLWGHFKDVVLYACDGVCGMKRGRISKGDAWWWNEDVKKAVSEKKMHTRSCAGIVLREIRLGMKV